MTDVERLWEEAEVLWEPWQKGHGVRGLTEFRVGQALIERTDLSTDTTTVTERRLYLQSRYEARED